MNKWVSRYRGDTQTQGIKSTLINIKDLCLRRARDLGFSSEQMKELLDYTEKYRSVEVRMLNS